MVDGSAAPKPFGRPPATSHAEIERVAFDLFDEFGFDVVTMEDIAKAIGVGRRTLFRYYPSKNDILWGQFDDSLARFAATLRTYPDDTPMREAILSAVVAFNSYEPAALPQHRQRMKLLLNTPTLLAHSELRYAAWRAVIADYVADRTGQRPADLFPSLVGRISLSISLAAYEQWLRQPRGDLEQLIREAFQRLNELTDSGMASLRPQA